MAHFNLHQLIIHNRYHIMYVTKIHGTYEDINAQIEDVFYEEGISEYWENLYQEAEIEVIKH